LWRAAAVRDGLMSRIAFMGFRDDVPGILAACDALVAPARYEAYGLGVHEALCCGIPAVVSAAAGVAERYPASLRELLLEDWESPDAVASCLVRWRERTSEVRALMMSFSEQLRARTWDDMARDIASLCDA
jgi:glycosyltransferase involved in cell wall biosynthesis